MNKDNACEKKMIQFAAEANAQYPGPLDDSRGCLSHMPSDLKHIRHYNVGTRHRIYISGHHKNCHYFAWFVKEFKRDGREVEGGKSFNRTLLAALNNPANTLLALDDDNHVVIEHQVDPAGDEG